MMATMSCDAGYSETRKGLRVLWICALFVSFALSVFASFRGGYIGPDYYTHFARLTKWSKIFDFSTTSPPTYYLVGHQLFLLIGNNKVFPITLSILQSALNALAIWCFFLYTERRFDFPLTHLGFVFFLAFLPVRVIHSTTIGTDSATIPLFVLLLFLFDRLISGKNSTFADAGLFGLGLALAVWTKYSFMGLIPAIFVLLLGVWRRRSWKLKRFLAICVLSLTAPSLLALHSFWASSRVHGYNTEKHWLTKGEAPDMDYRDLFSLKANDVELFRAPEYFRSEIRAPHEHSYLGLAHLGIFTDTMNLFQIPPKGQDLGKVWGPDDKTRRSWKTGIMQASMFLGVPWALLVLAAVPWSFCRAFRHFLDRRLEREDVASVLGTAFFLVMFLPIPFVSRGALFGFWTPRLILPALLCFFLQAFLLLDRKVARNCEQIAYVVLVLVTIQCSFEAAMLI